MCNTIGIAEISTDRGIKIFPNPAVDKVNFVVSEENIGGLMMICNMMGERVYQQQILKSEFQMDVSGFTSGLYWVVYFKNESAYTGKFFKTGVR